MQNKIKILYVDDSETDRELILYEFKKYESEFEITAVSNKKDFEEKLLNNNYDIVLTDYYILGVNAHDICDYIKSINIDIPVIVVTGTGSEQIAVDLMKKGISDYVIKSTSHIKKLPDTIKIVLKNKQYILDKKKAEKELANNLAKYKIIFDLFPTGITISDDKGNIIESNDISQDILGLPKEKQVERTIDGKEWKIIRKDGSIMPPEEFASVRALKEKKLIRNVEMGIVKEDGTITWINVSAAPIPIEGYGIAATYNDISEKIEAENALKNSEERLRLALDATSEAIFDWDLELNSYFFSSKLFSILSYSSDEFSLDFDKFTKLIHPDDLKPVNDIINDYKNLKRDCHEFVFRMLSKNYDWRWILWKGKLIKDKEQSFSKRIIGTFADFTDRIHLEENLKRRNRALQIISEINNIIISTENETSLLNKICNVIKNIGGYPFIWIGYPNNDEMKSITPIASAGRDLDELTHLMFSWGESQYGNCPSGKAIKTKKMCLIRNIRSDSDYILWLGDSLKYGYNSVIAYPLLNKGNPIGVISIYSESINGFSDEEIDLLYEITEDIAFGIGSIRAREEHQKLQKELFQSQKMEALGKLAGGIAHDFNNILTVISGNLELAKYNTDNLDMTLKYLERIQTATDKASSLTKQLLAFSRQEIIQPRIMNINKAVLDMEKILHRLIPENIKLILSLEPNLKNIISDPTHIDQIIMNLVVNAVDAMPQGGELIITTKNIKITDENKHFYLKVKEGEYAVLSVNDKGCGIPKEIIDKIFEPFFTTKVNGKGTGLGLSVVDGIVKQNNGFIEVFSEINKGTTFNIFLPVTDLLEIDQSDKKDTLISIKGEGKRILVLEDDVSINEMISTTLNSKGFIVFSAINIKNANEICEREKGNFDLVVSDVVLPDGSGIVFYENMISKYKNLKVIFTSGYADSKAKWDIIKQKGYDFIPKPFKINDLLQKINEVIFR